MKHVVAGVAVARRGQALLERSDDLEMARCKLERHGIE